MAHAYFYVGGDGIRFLVRVLVQLVPSAIEPVSDYL